MNDFREEEKLGKLYDSQITRRLMQYLRPYRLQVVLAGSFTLAIKAVEILGPFLFSVGIDRYIIPGFDGTIARTAAILGLVWIAAAYAGSIFASFGLQYVQVRIMQWVGQETMYDLRKEIFEHLQRLPMSFFDRSPIGRLVTRSTTDVDALNDLFASGVVAMLNDFVLLIAMAVFLFKWHPKLALATFSALPFLVLLSGRGIPEFFGHRAAFVGWGSKRDRRDFAGRRAGSLHDVRAAFFPADPGLEREIQHFAERHGGFGEDFPAAGRTSDDFFAGEDSRAASAARRNRISQRVVRVSRRRDAERGSVGAARCLLPRRTGADSGDCGPHWRGENHNHSIAAAFLRSTARRDFAGWRGYTRAGRARFAAAFWDRAAGPVPFHGHVGNQREARHHND